MSVMRHAAPGAGMHPDPSGALRELPRVRDLAREALALMAFSAGVSVACAIGLLLAFGLGH